ncbi:hypothetical protein [Nannocystis sp.]|uniref:hypothetical protein n=1 Tax=Nannocystis sp. TaxID=1962667 RepID=UPI0025F10985|nr:hypothetical protein [Nannocystis sp.]MBK7829346.1 hypothetical protein [Nannocystis sp.]
MPRVDETTGGDGLTGGIDPGGVKPPPPPKKVKKGLSADNELRISTAIRAINRTSVAYCNTPDSPDSATVEVCLAGTVAKVKSVTVSGLDKDCIRQVVQRELRSDHPKGGRMREILGVVPQIMSVRGRVRSLVAAMALLVGQATAVAGPARPLPGEPRSAHALAGQLYKQAMRLSDAGDIAGAIDLLRQAHQALVAIEAPPEAQSGIPWLLSDALREQWTRDGDLTRLDEALKILEDHRRAWGSQDIEAAQLARERAQKGIAELSRLRAKALYDQALARQQAADPTGSAALLQQALRGLETASALTEPLAREVVDALVGACNENFAATKDSQHLQTAEAALVAARKAWEPSSLEGRAEQLAHIEAQLGELRRQPIRVLHQSAIDAAASGDHRRAGELWTKAFSELSALGGLPEPTGAAIVGAAVGSAEKAFESRHDPGSLEAAKGLVKSYLEGCPAMAKSGHCELEQASVHQKRLQDLSKWPPPSPPPPEPSPHPPPEPSPHRGVLVSGAVLVALGAGSLMAMGVGSAEESADQEPPVPSRPIMGLFKAGGQCVAGQVAAGGCHHGRGAFGRGAA